MAQRDDEQALTAYAAMPCGITVQDAAGTLLYANPAAQTILGLPANALQGSNITDNWWPVTREDGSPFAVHDWPAMAAARTARPQRGVIMGVTRPDGERLWLQVDAVPILTAEGTVSRVVTSFTDVSTRVEAERSVKDLLHASEIIARMDTALAGTLDADELYHLILEQAAKVLPCQQAAIFLYEDGWGVLTAQWGVPAQTVGTRVFPLQPESAWQGRRVGPCIYVADTDDIPAWRYVPAFVGDVRIRSLIYAPLVVDGRLLGQLALSSTRPDAFTDLHLHVAGQFAERAIQALRNADHFAAEKARADQAEAMAAIGAALAGTLEPEQLYHVILEQAARLLSADCASVVLFLDGWARLAAAWGLLTPPIGARIFPVACADASGTPTYSPTAVIIPDTDADPSWVHMPPLVGEQRMRCVIGAPLVIDGEAVGYCNVQSRTAHRYHSGHLPIFNDLAERVTQALRNARLYAAEQESRRAAEELARLRQEHADQAAAMAAIGAALAETLELDRLYHVILEQVVRLVPADCAAVMLLRDGWVTIGAMLGEPSLPAGTRLFPASGSGKPWLPTDQPGLVYLPDASAQPGWVDVHPWLGKDRIRSLIAVPLIVSAETVGWFVIHSTVTHRYGEGQPALAAAFGERVTQALRNARLYTAERERARLAEHLALVRGELVANVSHELRTPLNAVVGYAELLRRHWGAYSESERIERIDHIVGAAERQSRLLADLVLLNRVEGGAVLPSPEPVVIAALARRAAAEVRAGYPGQRITLRGSAAPRVHVDAMHFLQVLVNLLDNAAKYSPEGSPISVTWRVEGEAVAIRVRDQGSGIPGVDRVRLFVPFGRVPSSRPRSGHSSTGLGLSLSRRLAESMGGSLDLETSGSGGSTFLLRLPRWEE